MLPMKNLENGIFMASLQQFSEVNYSDSNIWPFMNIQRTLTPLLFRIVSHHLLSQWDISFLL